MCFRAKADSVFVFLCILWFAAPAWAGTATSIAGLYTTGQERHIENWWMSVDNHWTSSNAEGKAYVIGFPPSGWAASSSAKWISASPTGYPDMGVNYSYALVFNVGGVGIGAVSNAVITLTLYVDDTATILVNGAQAAVVNGSNLYANPTTLALNSNFVIGANTIGIVVHNTGGAGGLMVSSISGVVPETGAWLPLVAALGLVGWLRLRGRKHSLPAAV